MALIPVGNEEKLERIPWVTLGIILVNTLVYGQTSNYHGADLDDIFRHYGFTPSSPSLLTLLTCMFLHADGIHLFGNTLFFWVYGAALENMVSRRHLLGVYLCGGIFASFFHAASTSIAHSGMDNCCIGSSGAVSAVMGMYLVRGWYTRIKVLVVLPFFLAIPKRFKIPALPLIGLFTLLQIYWGVTDHSAGIAYWAHVGGILFGLGLSLILGHIHQADLGLRRKRSAIRIDKRNGLRQTEEDLQVLLQANPSDAWTLHQLAKIKARSRLEPEVPALYRRAVRQYWKQGERGPAVEAYLEAYTKFRLVFPSRFQLDLAREMLRFGEWDRAARSLEDLIRRGAEIPPGERDQTLEKAYLMLANILADRLDNADAAARFLRDFLHRFPRSTAAEMVARKLELLFAAA